MITCKIKILDYSAWSQIVGISGFSVCTKCTLVVGVLQACWGSHEGVYLHRIYK